MDVMWLMRDEKQGKNQVIWYQDWVDCSLSSVLYV